MFEFMKYLSKFAKTPEEKTAAGKISEIVQTRERFFTLKMYQNPHIFIDISFCRLAKNPGDLWIDCQIFEEGKNNVFSLLSPCYDSDGYPREGYNKLPVTPENVLKILTFALKINNFL